MDSGLGLVVQAGEGSCSGLCARQFLPGNPLSLSVNPSVLLDSDVGFSF